MTNTLVLIEVYVFIILNEKQMKRDNSKLNRTEKTYELLRVIDVFKLSMCSNYRRYRVSDVFELSTCSSYIRNYSYRRVRVIDVFEL